MMRFAMTGSGPADGHRIMMLTAAGSTLAWANQPRHASTSTMQVRTLIMRASSQPGRWTIPYPNLILRMAGPRRSDFSGTFGRDAANGWDRRL